jgi:uncharacterized protein (TIGR03083 family)
MRHEQVLEAFAAEAAALAAVMLDLGPDEFGRPSPCPPWTVAGLLGHVATAVGWLPAMLAAPAPPQAEVSAADYYRADERFSPQTNNDRLALATRRAAAAPDGHALALTFDTDRQELIDLCRREPADRVVRTRHGDAMLLTDFLVTRIVEVGVHGLDLAEGLARPPWLTAPAAAVLTDLLLPGTDGPAGSGLLPGTDGPADAALLRKLTGRDPLTPDESARLARLGARRLTLG